MRLVGVAVVVVTTIVYSQQCWAQQLPSFLGPSGSGLGGPFGRRGNLTVRLPGLGCGFQTPDRVCHLLYALALSYFPHI